MFYVTTGMRRTLENAAKKWRCKQRRKYLNE